MKEITDLTKEVLTVKGKVLVKFFTPSCKPCKVLDKTLEGITSIRVVSVNAEVNGDLAGAYNVVSVPTLVLFEDGQPLRSMHGVRSLEDILRFIG